VSDDQRYPLSAPGWADLDRALLHHHGGRVPHQFTSARAYDLEGSDPLPAICVFEGEGPRHWHYVGYGLSELFEKTSPRADVSGFGFELALRLRRADGEDTPPRWPLRLLQGIAHYVLSGHGPLDSGHCVDLGAALEPGVESQVTGVLCIPDPRLGKIDTTHGSVLFLQLWGVTGDELEAMQRWDLPRKVGFAAAVDPVGITDPRRESLRTDPRRVALFRRFDLGIQI
jgi:hypothetical protein